MPQTTFNLQAPEFSMEGFRQDFPAPLRYRSENILEAAIDVQITNAIRTTYIETFDGVDRVDNGGVEEEDFDNIRLWGIVYKVVAGIVLDVSTHLGFGLTGGWTKVVVGPDSHFRTTIDVTEIMKAAVNHDYSTGEKVAIFVGGPRGVASTESFEEIALSFMPTWEADFEGTPDYGIVTEAATYVLLEYESALFQKLRLRVDKTSLDAGADINFNADIEAAVPILTD